MLTQQEIQIIENLKDPNVLSENFVLNEVHKRNIKISNAKEITLCFEDNIVFVKDHYATTQSKDCKISILKYLILQNILNKQP